MAETKQKRPRRDPQGRAYAGSQLQVQIYVNRRRQELDEKVLGELAQRGVHATSIRWVSPLERDGFAEYMDGAFLNQLGLGSLHRDLRAFWPTSGARWDGLALLLDALGQVIGYLLIEGKSYPNEMFGSGCQSPLGTPNRKLIDDTLAWAREQLEPEQEAVWTGRLYQSANRLAHVCFLRKVTDNPAWLVNLCFTMDPRTPWTEKDFRARLKAIKATLGWPSGAVPHTVEVFLPARARSELLTPSGPAA
jgi:hypothetical protein